ncbi:MAG: hypothetical protein NT141_02275 [candidate division WWE3 bacterium]|nr:hypothetical protein [candidate division WWE3 bacterium]
MNQEEITIKIGKSYSGFTYSGMPTSQSFSIVVGSYNLALFYPLETKTIYVANSKFDILKVTPEEITLRKV